jgi:hypothetical protein
LFSETKFNICFPTAVFQSPFSSPANKFRQIFNHILIGLYIYHCEANQSDTDKTTVNSELSFIHHNNWRITYYSSWRISLAHWSRHRGPPSTQTSAWRIAEEAARGATSPWRRSWRNRRTTRVGLQTIQTDGFGSPAHLEREKQGMAVQHRMRPTTGRYEWLVMVACPLPLVHMRSLLKIPRNLKHLTDAQPRPQRRRRIWRSQGAGANLSDGGISSPGKVSWQPYTNSAEEKPPGTQTDPVEV